MTSLAEASGPRSLVDFAELTRAIELEALYVRFVSASIEQRFTYRPDFLDILTTVEPP